MIIRQWLWLSYWYSSPLWLWLSISIWILIWSH